MIVGPVEQAWARSAAPTRTPQNSRSISLAVEKRYAQIKLRTRKKLKTLAGGSSCVRLAKREL